MRPSVNRDGVGRRWRVGVAAITTLKRARRAGPCPHEPPGTENVEKGDIVKRSMLAFLILGLALSSVATAEAEAARVERTVRGSYGPYPAPVTGCNSPMGSFACLIINTRTTEAFFTARVTDTHGQPVFVEVRSGGEEVATFCGATTRPVAFRGGSSLEFHVALNNWPPPFVSLDCPANRIKTTGTIRVTLSNLP